jgi:hypothetical protein
MISTIDRVQDFHEQLYKHTTTSSTPQHNATTHHTTTMEHHDHQYPEVEGGGSLILAWQVKNKKVLVIGGGEVRLKPSTEIHLAERES